MWAIVVNNFCRTMDVYKRKTQQPAWDGDIMHIPLEQYIKHNTRCSRKHNSQFLQIRHSSNTFGHTVVPALGDPRRERTPAMHGHVINVPTHFNVKLPAIGGHLPNADADSHLLVVRTCYNGQFKQMPRFRRSFQPKIARGGHPNLRPTFCSNIHAAIW